MPESKLDLRTVAAFHANLERAITQIAGRLNLNAEEAEQLAFAHVALARHKRIGASRLIGELAVVAEGFIEEANAERTAPRN